MPIFHQIMLHLFPQKKFKTLEKVFRCGVKQCHEQFDKFKPCKNERVKTCEELKGVPYPYIKQIEKKGCSPIVLT
jgi:uncharacterized protein Yka (UPF0111/DUF47 family)